MDIKLNNERNKTLFYVGRTVGNLKISRVGCSEVNSSGALAREARQQSTMGKKYW